MPKARTGGPEKCAGRRLEGANVNATEELITSITTQRAFEMNMRMINTAKELDEAGTEIMQAPA